jgi:hypothetical protein
MRRIIAFTVASGIVALAGAAPALADGSVPFQAQVNQLALGSQSCDAGVCRFEGGGSGGANTMGPISFRIDLVQDFTVVPVQPLQRPDHVHRRDWVDHPRRPGHRLRQQRQPVPVPGVRLQPLGDHGRHRRVQSHHRKRDEQGNDRR